MDFGTILGLLSGIGIIFLGILRQDGDLGWFMNINSIIIVFGGTIAAAMVNYPLKNIIGLFSILKNFSDFAGLRTMPFIPLSETRRFEPDPMK